MKIVIVGGGSAGWITASYLNAVLNDGSRQPIGITVVESPNVGRIGVGEATVPSIRQTLSRIGMSEPEFMKAADATFKNAIRFDNWREGDFNKYYHPFDRRAYAISDGVAEKWLMSQRNVPWDHYVSALASLSESGHAPKALSWPDFGSPFPYAYHMDAEKFAEFLSRHSTARGVGHIRDDVVDAAQDETGNISTLKLKSGCEIAADLFVDCTGFASVLIEKTLGVGWVDFSRYLLCDRAIAMRVPRDAHDAGPIRPFTISAALEAGWAWDIGLSDRRGRGYVYSSQHIDDDTAEARLREVEGPHAADLDARRLRFKVGYREQFWAKNVIAIGLSSGFVEPLESTALYTVEFAASALCDLIPAAQGDLELARDHYNRTTTLLFNEILDFVNLHYALSDRRDTEFWRDATRPERRTDFIANRMELWKRKAPSHLDFDQVLQLFSPQSYEYILYGMNYGPDAPGNAQPIQTPLELARIISASQAKFPLHGDWLKGKLGV